MAANLSYIWVPVRNIRASMLANLKHPLSVSNHKQEIKKKMEGLGNHYGGKGSGYENLKIQKIVQVELGNSEAQAAIEVYW